MSSPIILICPLALVLSGANDKILKPLSPWLLLNPKSQSNGLIPDVFGSWNHLPLPKLFHCFVFNGSGKRKLAQIKLDHCDVRLRSRRHKRKGHYELFIYISPCLTPYVLNMCYPLLVVELINGGMEPFVNVNQINGEALLSMLTFKNGFKSIGWSTHCTDYIVTLIIIYRINPKIQHKWFSRWRGWWRAAFKYLLYFSNLRPPYQKERWRWFRCWWHYLKKEKLHNFSK